MEGFAGLKTIPDLCPVAQIKLMMLLTYRRLWDSDEKRYRHQEEKKKKKTKKFEFSVCKVSGYQKSIR